MPPKKVRHVRGGLEILLTGHRSRIWTSSKAIKSLQESAHWRSALPMCLSSLSHRPPIGQSYHSDQDRISALPTSHLRASLRPDQMITCAGLTSRPADWLLADRRHNNQYSCTACPLHIHPLSAPQGRLQSFQTCVMAPSFLLSLGWKKGKTASRAQQDQVQLHTTTGATSLGPSKGRGRNKFQVERGTRESSRLCRSRTSWS